MVLNSLIEDFKSLVKENNSITELNTIINEKTGIVNFFKNSNDINNFLELSEFNNMITWKQKDLGDFQTPINLTDKVCQCILDIGCNPTILIEPTCGIGNFIISALKIFPSLKNIYCIELQEKYEWLFKLNLLKNINSLNPNIKIEFFRDNIFSHQFSPQLLLTLHKSPNSFLILGNPPWITNTELSILNSNNIPIKYNIKGLKGLDAITGKGNFDIAEYILIHLIKLFSEYEGTIAMLCKTSVIKNIVKEVNNLNLCLSNIKMLKIDTKKEFKINAEGALFFANIGQYKRQSCTVSSLYQPNISYSKFGWSNNKFVSNIQIYNQFSYLDEKSQYIWRQGVKHDAAKIMVLRKISNGLYINGLNETVKIEDDCLYPLIKSSDIKNPIINSIDKKIIITQFTLNEDTKILALKYPNLWNYLNNHIKYFNKRKSVIYRNRPQFSIFGVGDYTFLPYKIAISGFYKIPNFALVPPYNNEPVIFDDTCYYLSFNNFKTAIITWILLNTNEVKNFLSSIVFLDSKRPYTKEKLMRINLHKLIDVIPIDKIINFYNKNLRKYLEYNLNKQDFLNYREKIII
ncbi:MAG: methyltransferase [Candidatus Helarchaeota archaeon]